MQDGNYVVQVKDNAVVQGVAPIPADQYVSQQEQSQGMSASSPFHMTHATEFYIGVVVVIVFILCCMVRTKQQTVKIVERMGKYKKTLNPGIGFRIPWIDKIAKIADLRTQQLNIQIDTKTKDNVFVRLLIAVQVKIEPTKVYDAVYMLQDWKAQIDAYLSDAIRGKVPNLDLDAVFSSKDDIAKSTKEALVSDMTGYGFNIMSVLITEISPDSKVVDAMNEINAAKRMLEATASKADAAKLTTVKQAEAESESKALQGKGIADERKAIIEGMKSTVADMVTATGLNPKEVMIIMMMTQYFDTLKATGAGSKVILLPNSPSGVTDLMSQIQKAIISGNEVESK